MPRGSLEKKEIIKTNDWSNNTVLQALRDGTGIWVDANAMVRSVSARDSAWAEGRGSRATADANPSPLPPYITPGKTPRPPTYKGEKY